MENQFLCRSVQWLLKGGLYFIRWKTPKLLQGANALELLVKDINAYDCRKVLLVTTASRRNMKLLQGIRMALERQQIQYEIFSDVQSNPTDRQVECGVTLFQIAGCDSILCFGGGSVIDCGKAIGARIARPRKTIRQLQGIFRVRHALPPLFAVPTTAGSGSEGTNAAVITCEKERYKAALIDPVLVPNAVALIPSLTVGMPPQLTAETGMDAFCHAVEAYTNHMYLTRYEEKLCKKAIFLISRNLRTVYQDGSNQQAREEMQLAAFYAGQAFQRGAVGYVHAIAHALSGLYGIAHGLAVAVVLPIVLRQYGTPIVRLLAELYDCMEQAEMKSNSQKAEAFLLWLETMNRYMGIPSKIEELQRGDFGQIISWAEKEANPWYPTPVVWHKSDFQKVLEQLIIRKN